jgi:hypothetical protein
MAAAASSSAQSASLAAALASIWSARLSIRALEVVHLGGGVGLHLGPLAAGLVPGRLGVLDGVGGGLVDIDLGLVDALAQLLAGLGDGGLGGLLGLGGALLEVVELGREVHDPSLLWVACLSCC